MRAPLVIALVGIDGAGKTTQARRLADGLNAGDTPARFLKNPGGRLRLDRIARRLGRRDAIGLLGRYGFLVSEVLVRFLMIARALLWSRLSRRVAVMDRYTLCEYAVIRARGDRGERVARWLYAVFRQPDLVCFLAVSPAEAYRRIERRGTDTDTLGYLQSLDSAYRTLPEAASYTTIDADGPPDSVEAALRDAVETRLTAREPVS